MKNVKSPPKKVALVAPVVRIRRTQEQRRAEAEQRLLDAARELVGRKGWVGMTLGDVGAAAGYSRGLAAHHFGSKPELLRALSVHIGQHFMSAFGSQASRTEGLQTILEFVQAYLGRDESQWANVRALLILMAEGTTDETEAGANLAIYNQALIDFLSRQFAVGIARQDILDDVDATSSAIALLGTLRGVMLQRLLKNSTVDLPAAARSVVRSTIRAYAVRPKAWLGH